MALPFRQRIFVVLVALTAVPTALAVVGWALAVRTVGPSAGARVALEEMAASARQMVDRIDTTHLALRERAAVRDHLERLSTSVTLARRAENLLGRDARDRFATLQAPESRAEGDAQPARLCIVEAAGSIVFSKTVRASSRSSPPE